MKFNSTNQHLEIDHSTIFRGIEVIGQAGSGKTYNITTELIISMINAGYSMFINDYKKSDQLSKIAYNAFIRQKNETTFCLLDFEDLEKTIRCNVIHPNLIKCTDDACAVSKAFLSELIQKKSEEPEVLEFLLAGGIWALKLYENGKYCSIPHLIELITFEKENLVLKFLNQFKDDEFIHKVLVQIEEKEVKQLRELLLNLKQPNIYYVMTQEAEQDDLLVLNEIENPKIFCLRYCDKKQKLYAPLISSYTTMILRNLIRKVENQIPTGIVLEDFSNLSLDSNNLLKFFVSSKDFKFSTIFVYENINQLKKAVGEGENEKVITDIVQNKFESKKQNEFLFNGKKFEVNQAEIKRLHSEYTKEEIPHIKLDEEKIKEVYNKVKEEIKQIENVK